MTMTTPIATSKPQKTQYTAEEAASVLGVSIEQLHTLIRQHLAVEDGDMSNVIQTQFQASDLLLLRFLAQK
ncbi:MAG: hypothetical protein K2X03_07125 [Bryobacteraceae bacterium]|nr:hypothetical protein [Bryobacteraceae bacterium]